MGLPTIASYPLPTKAELPSPRGPWQLEAQRVALLVHDMQRYFLRPFDAAASPLAPAIENIKALIAAARARNIPIFYTAQKGNQLRKFRGLQADQFRPDRGLQADLWGPGMQAIEEHEPVITELAPQPGDHVLVKHRYSAFQRSNLESLLQESHRDQLLITGVYAHIGCMATAVEAFQRDVETFIAADAVADFSRANHDLALHWIADCCGVPLTTHEILERLK